MVKKKINLDECIKMSVFTDYSWEIVDKHGSYRFLASNNIENDEWRSLVEKALKIQKNGLEQSGIKLNLKKSFLFQFLH